MKSVTKTYINLISGSIYFNSEWYVSQYPDVKKTGLGAIEHYLLYGADELRDPGPSFNTKWYLAEYSEVSLRQLNPLIHFILHGSKQGYATSPYGLLRNKTLTLQQASKSLLRKYSDSAPAIPDHARSNNWENIRPQWVAYYLGEGINAYKHGDNNKALHFFKYAIQISPDKSDGYQLYQHVFRQINHHAIERFERTYAHAKLIVGHISCRSRTNLAEKSCLSFHDPDNRIANLIVVGEPALPDHRFEFDPENNLLRLPASDDYEGLPVKMKQLFLFLGLTSLEMPLLKVDDDIHCRNMDQLNRDLGHVMVDHDYGGWFIRQKPFSATTYWHLNKCSDPEVNDRPDGLLFVRPYAKGPVYWLGNEAINALSKIALIHERYFDTEIYEDRAVGTLLDYYGFTPFRFDLIGSGSLKIAGENRIAE